MLIEFSVGNYRSFKDVVTFSMVATNTTARHKEIDGTNTFIAKGELKLLKSAVLYGANASGKSNLIKALGFMKHLVLNSSRETMANEPIEVDKFRLNTAMDKKPSYFEIVFIVENIRYRYGFEIYDGIVFEEWLYRTKIREVILFERTKQDISLSSAFKEGKNLEKRTRENALFLSVVAQWNGKISQEIARWFQSTGFISGLDDTWYRRYTIKQVIEDTQLKEKIIHFIKQLDTGILNVIAKKTEISEEQLPQNMPANLRELFLGGDLFSVTTTHQKYDNNVPTGLEKFDLDLNESEGTQKIFSIAGPILHTLQRGQVLIIDELDARFHPLITRFMVQLFNSNETNPHNAQLIFATHDTNLLNNKFFRRDQIWFTEKDKYGATDLYSLVEFKIKGEKVRNDASFENDYILGKYGAIPFLGDIQNLIGEPDA